MSSQITDPFIWEKTRWSFIEAENILDLFDPEEYGMIPESISTDCWKGFIITFRVKNRQLYLDDLIIHNANKKYPRINGMKPRRDRNYWHMKHYEDIGLKLDYSGRILIGKNKIDEYKEDAFDGPYSYERVYELVFDNGLCIGCEETSGQYSGF